MKILSLSLIAAMSLAASAFGKTPVATPKLLEKAKSNYAVNCASCHGVHGDGNGPIGKLLNPKPRDFANSTFKNGDKVEQIFLTLANGLDGTAMTSFKHLSEEDRWGLAHHVKNMLALDASAKKKT